MSPEKVLICPKTISSVMVWFSSIIQSFGTNRSEANHFVFYRHSPGGVILLVVYVDDIVIIGDDEVGIGQLKTHLHSHFQTKNLGRLKVFSWH